MRPPFYLVPANPFGEDDLKVIQQRLAEYPSYQVPGEPITILFASEIERKETVQLYTRSTSPIFDFDTFVHLAPSRLLLHLGENTDAHGNLREFVQWCQRWPHHLERNGAEFPMDVLMPLLQ